MWPSGDRAQGGDIPVGIAEKVGSWPAQAGGLGGWETLGQWGWQEGAGQGEPTGGRGRAGPHVGWPRRAVAFCPLYSTLVRL